MGYRKWKTKTSFVSRGEIFRYGKKCEERGEIFRYKKKCEEKKVLKL